MEYIDSNRVLCAESESVKWPISKKCTLPEISGSVRVFDYSINDFRQQSTDKFSWNSYLVSIGVFKLSPYQKIDSNGNIALKTIDEIYSSGVITSEQYKALKTEEIKSSFDYACVKTGIAMSGTFSVLPSGTASNPKFQYDFDSINKLESVVSDARVGYWRSVDNQNIVLTNQDKQTLLELLKVTYFTKFAESRAAIDAL